MQSNNIQKLPKPGTTVTGDTFTTSGPSATLSPGGPKIWITLSNLPTNKYNTPYTDNLPFSSVPGYWNGIAFYNGPQTLDYEYAALPLSNPKSVPHLSTSQFSHFPTVPPINSLSLHISPTNFNVLTYTPGPKISTSISQIKTPILGGTVTAVTAAGIRTSQNINRLVIVNPNMLDSSGIDFRLYDYLIYIDYGNGTPLPYALGVKSVAEIPSKFPINSVPKISNNPLTKSDTRNYVFS